MYTSTLEKIECKMLFTWVTRGTGASSSAVSCSSAFTSCLCSLFTSLKIWSCLIYNEQDQNVKLKASLQHAERKKLTASVLMGFVLIATLCLKPWVTFTTSVFIKSCVLLSLKRIFNVVGTRESSTHWDDTIYKK